MHDPVKHCPLAAVRAFDVVYQSAEFSGFLFCSLCRLPYMCPEKLAGGECDLEVSDVPFSLSGSDLLSSCARAADCISSSTSRSFDPSEVDVGVVHQGVFVVCN